MVNLTLFLLLTSAVTCVAFWCDSTCTEALTDYCSDSDDADTVCDKCLENEGLCERTNDPLFCYMHLKEGSNCTWSYDPCNANTSLSYGCASSGYCYSQCVGEEYGDWEWCYVGSRQLGSPPRVSCEEDEDCAPAELGTVQCSSGCDTTFSK